MSFSSPGLVTSPGPRFGGGGGGGSDGEFHVQKIAVVGAGPSGLAAAKHLLAVGAPSFARIDVFEQQAEVGGVWNYSATPQPAHTLKVPQTDAHGPPDPPVILTSPSSSLDGDVEGKGKADTQGKGGEGLPPPPLFPSPMYDDLHTNIPHTLMRYSDLPFPSSGESEAGGGGEGEGEGEKKEKKNKGSCAIFPSREVVQEYLVAYARNVRHLIRFSTQVVDITSLPPPSPSPSPSPSDIANTTTQDERWAVRTKNLLTNTVETQTYDAVVVASGHYATPHIPAIEGLAAFAAAHPGAVSHSKLYRRAAAAPQYRDKKVLVVGNSASGLDIASQIRAVARKPVLVSARTPTAPEALRHIGGGDGEVEEVPEIRRFLVEGRGVEFWGGGKGGKGGGDAGVGGKGEGDEEEREKEEDEEVRGRIETDIDTILFCTGYLYTFPFLESLSSPSSSLPSSSIPNNNNNNNNNNPPPPPPLITDGRRVHNLARHLLHTHHPTLAFPGLPSKVIPFPLAEAQMAVVARLWANLLPRPTRAELARWAREDEEAWLARHPDGDKNTKGGFHVFAKGEDGRYINAMHDWAMRAAAGGEGKGKGKGKGKEPPHWDEHALWQRTIYAEAKMRFEETGKKARTLEELGFRFEPPPPAGVVAAPLGGGDGEDGLDVAG